MRLDLKPTQQEFNDMSKEEQIDSLCSVYECKEKKRKLHYQQYVHRQWKPHPPQRFMAWWASDGVHFSEKKTNRGWGGVPATVAFNCEAVREAYTEAKNLGLI